MTVAFKIYDIDRDGYISNGELFQVLKMMVGNNLKDGQLQQIVDKTIIYSDKDGDGRISYDEFCAVSALFRWNLYYTVKGCHCLWKTWISPGIQRWSGKSWGRVGNSDGIFLVGGKSVLSLQISDVMVFPTRGRITVNTHSLWKEAFLVSFILILK